MQRTETCELLFVFFEDTDAYPLNLPLALSASRDAAISNASGFSSVTACKAELTSVILAIYV